MTDGDAQLVERSRNRDTIAFGELVQRHQRLVFGVALARCKDPTLAEDLAQDAFVTAWRDLDQLRDGQRVGSWVAGIARNLAASAVRTAVRREQAIAPVADDVPSPEDVVLEREDRELLAHALADVSDSQRETLVLYYLEGESIARIAEGLEISEDLVKQRLSRGRRELRDGVAKRVETALTRTRQRPALRAGVIAALATVSAKQATAATTGKVIALMTIKKLTLAAALVTLTGGAIWFATRSSSEQEASASLPVAAPLPTKSTQRIAVRKIDEPTRVKLLGEIRATAQRNGSSRTRAQTAGTSSSSTGTATPEIPPGDIDKAYIRGAVREIIPLLTECYEQGLADNPKLAGTIVVSFTLEGEPGVGGVVGDSEIVADKTTLAHTGVQECIKETMFALEIDPPANGGVVRVNYPFEFRPATPEEMP